MYRKLVRIPSRYFYSQAQLKQLQQLSLSVFVSNKSIISFSKYLRNPEYPKDFPNCYVDQQIAQKMIIPGHIQLPKTQKQLIQKQQHTLGVIRAILKSNIAGENITIDINTLKKNQVFKKIIELKDHKRYRTQTARVLINDQISPTLNQKSDINKYLKVIEKNMLELQKLIQIGLNLNIAYVISKDNYACPEWVKLLNKKRKAINSNILMGQKQQNLPQLIHEQGYKLQHIFLQPFKKKDGDKIIEKTQDFQQNNAYNQDEVIHALKTIGFTGKIILQDNSRFFDNIQFFEAILKKNGYSQQLITQQQYADKNDNWFARI